MLKDAQQQPKENVNPFAGRKYIRAVGRRKSAVANIKLYAEGQGLFLVNRKQVSDYFPHFAQLDIIESPLKQVGKGKELDINVRVSGGGAKGQAEAVKLGVARALAAWDTSLRLLLRKASYLTVDARVKERKKPGLKRARRAPQWSKR